MKRWILFPVFALVAALLLPSVGGAGPLVQWDQRNDGPVGNGKQTVDSVSESFTPALSELDTVELCVASWPAAAELQVTIRDAGGSVVGTSATQTTVPAGNSNPLLMTFTFDSPVSLTPGDAYAIDGVVVSGAAWAFRTADLGSPPWGVDGLWYREGLGVADIDPGDVASYAAAPTCVSPWFL